MNLTEESKKVQDENRWHIRRYKGSNVVNNLLGKDNGKVWDK